MEMSYADRKRAWIAGLNRIRDDHHRLQMLLEEMQEVCCEFYHPDGDVPDRQEIASCEGRLNSFAHDFIDFLVRHFEREELWMVGYSGNGALAFTAHHQDHLRIIQHLEDLLQSTIAQVHSGNAGLVLQEFHHCVQETLEEHARKFDTLILQPRDQDNNL
jgi:hemerythrin